MTPEELGLYIAAVGAAAIAAIEVARRVMAALKDLKKDLAENTAETKNGHEARQKMIDELATLRNETMSLRAKQARLESIEAAMLLLEEGRAFRDALDKHYGWRVAKSISLEETHV
jgi:hypothetical protein